MRRSLAALVVVAVFVLSGAAQAEAPCVGKQRADFGEWVYMTRPDYIIRAIRVAEGVPSYGVMYLAEKYGNHKSVPWREGREAAAGILHQTFREWTAQRAERGNCAPSFIRYLGGKYAPLNAGNDSNRLNHNWVQNVTLNVAMQIAEEESR